MENPSIQILIEDPECERRVLTDVRVTDKYVELKWDAMGFAYDRKLAPHFIPARGMETLVVGSFGRPVRGLAIDGRVIYYRTPAEEDERHLQWVQQKERDDQDKYKRDKPDHDARIAKLPTVFQERIQQFRAFSPTWGWRFEGYELFCCEQAVIFAEALRTPEAVKGFHAASWERQKREVPALSDQHSGNTFGAACHLASLYLSNPELIPRAHGSICPLVGCEEFGCWSYRKTVFPERDGNLVD